MTYQIDIRDALLGYLSAEFKGANIKEVTDDQSYSFSVMSDGQRYFLRVMLDSVSDLTADDIVETMQSFSVSQTMRNLGDFPVVVTESGCIFGSP
jgi:hypothetical protein